MPLLDIRDLTLDLELDSGRVRVLRGVSLRLEAGRTLCLVGESGCGKSVTALSIAKLVPTPPAVYAEGSIAVEGRDVFGMSHRELREIRGGVVSYVFQEPGASLNPVMRAGDQVLESLRLHRPAHASREEVIRLLKLVGIPAAEARWRDYPFQLSGGMQQRVMIAMALASGPRLLIADEPTTALDVTIQAQILELLRDLQQQLGMAILLITHNLGIVRDMGGEVAVMYAGQIVEQAPAAELLRAPLHPYTRALLDSVPRLYAAQHRLSGIPGIVPRPGQVPAGCAFAPRCAIARADCQTVAPALVETSIGRHVRCPYAAEPASVPAP